MRAARIANEERVALCEVSRIICISMNTDKPTISGIRLARRYPFGDHPRFCVLTQMDHLGAGISLLMIIGDGD